MRCSSSSFVLLWWIIPTIVWRESKTFSNKCTKIMLTKRNFWIQKRTPIIYERNIEWWDISDSESPSHHSYSFFPAAASFSCFVEANPCNQFNHSIPARPWNSENLMMLVCFLFSLFVLYLYCACVFCWRTHITQDVSQMCSQMSTAGLFDCHVADVCAPRLHSFILHVYLRWQCVESLIGMAR